MIYRVLGLLMAGALISACGGSGDSGNGGGGEATGEVRFSMTDAPVDSVTQVHLTVTAVGLKPSDGPEEKEELDEPLVVDNLLDLQGTNAVELIPFTEVPAGRYNWLRLYVLAGDGNTYVVEDGGGEVPLYVPGQQNNVEKERHVQLVSGFVVPAGGQADFTLDVDLRRALTQPANQDYYLLRPAMRIVDNTEVGVIQGSVADALVSADNCTADPNTNKGNAVYLYQGAGATPGDIYEDDTGTALDDQNPVSTANVVQQDSTYAYEFGFVPPGDYTVAFTCQGQDDDPSVNDDTGDNPRVTFSAQADVTVEADSTATADLQ